MYTCDEILESKIRRYFLKSHITPDGCLELDNNAKRPTIHHDGKTQNFHRLLMEYAGYDLTRKVVAHRCDNGRCFYMAHLFVTSQSGNIHDMYEKGRSGDNGHMKKRKLTIVQALEIRNLYATKEHTMRWLAEKYSVSLYTIQKIINNSTYVL